MLRRNKATNLQWIKFQREEHMAPGSTEVEREKLGQEYDTSELVNNLKAKDLTHQLQIDAVLPKETRARNFDN